MIIGEGSDGLSFLKAKVERLGIVDHVVFAGYRKDIRELLQISEIFILTSRYEGLPMVLMEAASQGIACIAYDCISGPSDIIEDKVSGVLVADQDKDEMTRKVISLIENPEQRKELGKNAVLASENFSLEKIGTLWQELFQKIL